MSVARLSARVIVLVLFAPVFCEPAVAQTQQQLDWCDHKNGATPDLLIEGCTAVIQAGKYTGKGLAFAFNNRGIAYQNKGQYDRAVQDYDHAIKLNPKYAEAFYDRSNTYVAKGQYDRAIQDYDQAIKLNPNFASAFNNRGVAYAHKEQYERAIKT